ncbi:MAG TPA: hypothetical protein PKC19_15165 [Roseiflexaceae bacterium]|nr:hypothetical protein [Roseiflexaceae bacterium]
MQIDIYPSVEDPVLVAAITAAVAALTASEATRPAVQAAARAWRLVGRGAGDRSIPLRWATAERLRRGRASQGSPWMID